MRLIDPKTLPLLIFCTGAFVSFLAGRLLQIKNRVQAVASALILLGGLISMVINTGKPETTAGQMPGLLPAALEISHLRMFILGTAVFLGIILFIFYAARPARDRRQVFFYPLILLTIAGLYGMFTAQDLFTIFLFTELISICASVLIAFRYTKTEAVQAGFKYLIMSSIGTMTMLLGIYFVYRSSGDVSLLALKQPADLLTRIAAGCFLVGLSIKAGVVPLHTWVPDAYSNAKASISGYLAGVLSKSMLFLIPLICLPLGLDRQELGLYFLMVSVLNMLLGAIKTLTQQRLQAFLAYSTIAQSGYLLFSLGVGYYFNIEAAFTAALFGFFAIAVMKSLAFYGASIFEQYFDLTEINALKGLHSKMPVAVYAFSIALAGLAGIPLLAGFTTKWLALSAALATGSLTAVIFMVFFLLASLISLGGYLPLLVKLYLPAVQPLQLVNGENSKLNIWILIPVLLLSGLTLLLGILPMTLIDFVRMLAGQVMR